LTLTVPGLPADLTGVAISSDGQRFAVSSLDGTVTICNAHSGEIIYTLPGKAGPVYGVAFHPKSNALASAHHDGTVKVWDSTKGHILWSKLAHADAVLGVSYSADGRLLASAGGRHQSKNIGIWEASTGEPLQPLHGDGFVHSVAFSPDSTRLACMMGRKVALWDVMTSKEFDSLSLENPCRLRVAFSPNGQRLALACKDQTVRLWDPGKGQKLVPFRVFGGELSGVASSPDGRYLATCSGYKGKGTIQIWDATLWDVPGP
jgi:WD40 repeat protein